MLNLFGLSFAANDIVIVAPFVAEVKFKYFVCTVKLDGAYVSDIVSPQAYTVGVGVGVGVDVMVGVGVTVAVTVGVGVGDPLSVGVGVAVAVGVTVDVAVGVSVGVAPGIPEIEIHCVVPEQLPPSTLIYNETTPSGIFVIVFGKLDTDCAEATLEHPLAQDAPVQPDIVTVCPEIPEPIEPKLTEALKAIFYKYKFFRFI